MVEKNEDIARQSHDPTVDEDHLHRQHRLERAMEEVVESIAKGQQYDREVLLTRYADVATELEECLGSLEFVHSVAPQLSPHRANGVAEATPASHVSERIDIGDFRILREIGRGGMGVVYEAEQLSMARRVALKVLPFAALLDHRQLQRFKTEARAAGCLHHPHIVPVFSVGTERGIHYYAMQLVEGPSLSEVIQCLDTSAEDAKVAQKLDQLENDTNELLTPPNSLPPPLASETHRNIQAAISTKRSTSKLDYHRTVAHWGQQAADALAYAHKNGVLHRDIKPANLLVDEAFNVMVTDFGLARLESDASMTMTGDVLGTLRYMAPEQALGQRVLVDQRADIYSLGVTLYELLTTRPAFAGSDRQAVLHKIAVEEPIAPRRIDAAIPADLETIILKAAAKAAEDRYASAAELADDLGRFLANKTISARPPTLADRSRKWLRQHRLVAWSISATLVVLSLASIGGLAWTQHKNAQLASAVSQAETKTKEATTAHAQTQQALSDAQRAEQQARKSLYLATMRQAHDDLRRHNSAGFAESMLRFMPKSGEHDLRGWEWYYLLSLYHQEEKVLREHVNGVMDVAFHPAGRFLATSSADGTVRLWDPVTWSLVSTIGHLSSAEAIAWHPDGELLAVATAGKKLHVWNIANGKKVGEHALGGTLRSQAFSPNGKHFAAAIRDMSLNVWDVTTLQPIWSQDVRGAMCVAWSPDGSKLAYGTNTSESELRILDATSGDAIGKVGGFETGVFDLAWSPSGEEIAVCEAHKAIKVFAADNLMLLHSTNVSGTMEKISWSPNGMYVATGIGRNVHVHDRQLKLQTAFSGHAGTVLSLDWKSDNKTLVAGATGGTTRVWNVDQTPNLIGTRVVIPDLGAIGESTTIFGSTGDFLAVLDPSSHELVVHRLSNGAVLRRYEVNPGDGVAAIAWNGDDTWLAHTDSGAPSIVLRKLANAQRRNLARIQEGRIRQLDWSPVGKRLAAVVAMDEELQRNTPRENVTTSICIWNTETGEIERSISVRAPTIRMAWDPFGERIASVEYSGWGVVGRIWDASTGEVLHTLSGHHRNVGVPKWSPDGNRIAAFGWMGHISIWDAHSGILQHRLIGHESKTTGVWHPDGQRFLSLGEDGSIRLWDVESGERILGIEANYRNAMFSPDGRSLYLCGTSLDVIDVEDSVVARERQLVESAGAVLIHRRAFQEAEDLIESLEPGSPERLYLLRLLFDRNRAGMGGRDAWADGSLATRLAKLLELWKTLVVEIRAEDSNRLGTSEAQRLSMDLLYCANRAPYWQAHYAQDVVPVISIMEQIVDQVGNHAESSSPPELDSRISHYLDQTRKHIERLLRDNQAR